MILQADLDGRGVQKWWRLIDRPAYWFFFFFETRPDPRKTAYMMNCWWWDMLGQPISFSRQVVQRKLKNMRKAFTKVKPSQQFKYNSMWFPVSLHIYKNDTFPSKIYPELLIIFNLLQLHRIFRLGDLTTETQNIKWHTENMAASQTNSWDWASF